MSLSNIAALVLRFFALSWLVTGLSGVLMTVFSVHVDFSWESLIISLTPVFYLLCALLAWYFAPFVAGFLTRGIDSSITLNGLTRTDLYCFAFVIIGLWYVLLSLPNAIIWIHSFLRASTHEGT